MYIREILARRASPVENGEPVLGTWNSAFEAADLLEIRKPYQCALPRWVRDYRVKEWEWFTAQNGSFLLEALLCNVKLYRMAQILFFDRETGEKFVFRKVIPGKGWQFPRSLANSSVDGRSSGFFFRIHSWLDADTITLDLNIEPAWRRPPLTVHLSYNMCSQYVTPMAVSLGITGRRIMYACKALAPVRGDMVFDGKHISLNQETTSGFFCDYKGFFPYRMLTTICSASGFDAENRRFGFHIAENQTRETNKNNENALWAGGRLTPLPPVRITMPGGPDSSWIIQDVEGMVDLTFTPKEPIRCGMGLVVTYADYIAPLGFYNGMLVNADGERIQIRNLFGMGKKLYLRV